MKHMTKQKISNKLLKAFSEVEIPPLEHYFKNEKKLSDKAMDKIETGVKP